MTYKQLVHLKENDLFYHVEKNNIRELKFLSKDCIVGVLCGIDTDNEIHSYRYTEVQIEKPLTLQTK